MLATHPQAVQLKGVVGVGAGEEVVGEEEEEEHRRQEQTLHGLLWTVSECVTEDLGVVRGCFPFNLLTCLHLNVLIKYSPSLCYSLCLIIKKTKTTE